MVRCLTCPLRTPNTNHCRYYGRDIKRPDMHQQFPCSGYHKAKCFAYAFGKKEECVLCAGRVQCEKALPKMEVKT